MSVLVQATNRREACTPFQSSLLLAEKYGSNEKRKFFVTVILCLLFTAIATFAFFIIQIHCACFAVLNVKSVRFIQTLFSPEFILGR